MDNIGDIYELSSMQQGMLFHTLYDSGAGVYFEQLSCTLQGALDVVAFRSAWQRVMERHPVLRTSFHWEDLNKPLQVVHTRVELPWTQQDWRSLSPAEQQEQFEAFSQTDRERGFALEQAPLMRCALMRVAEDTYHFVWSHHHLLIDGWSLSIVLKEVFVFYNAFSQGRQVALSTPRPYRDYIAWLQQQDRSQAEAFWRQQLRGFTAPTPLCTNKTMDDLSDQKGIYAEQRFQISAAVTADLQSMARQSHVTLNTLVQVAWALLLSRYSGEEDIVFGVTTSGRPAKLPGVESMVGLFINTLPAQVHVSGEASLLLWLQQVQAQQVEREQYAYSSLVEIQGWSDVPRGLPLFESIVVFENYPVDSLLQERIGSLAVNNVRALERTNYPLTVIVGPGSELLFRVLYDEHCFDATAIRRMAGHFQTILEGLVAQPEQRLAAVPMLTEAERHQLVVEWNTTQVPYPAEACVHDLFTAQAEHTPEAIAVVFDDAWLSYAALEARANQLAHFLLTLGAGPEVQVGLCLERSIALAVGLLGIVKSGSAYVPLDPSYPPERLEFMLEDANVSVLVTHSRLRDLFPTTTAHILCLDTDWDLVATQPQDSPESGVFPQNPVYVLYTSGSTGRPKGVALPHRSLVNLLSWQGQRFQAKRTLQFAPISFDVSFQEFFATWCTGGVLELVSEERRRDFWQLLDWLTERQVKRVFLPFVALQQLAEVVETSRRAFPHGCELVTAGEQLTTTSAVRALCQQTSSSLENQYGPTESHVVTAYRLPDTRNTWTDLPPIGKPIANTAMYVLDTQQQPVPIGVAGELYISGVALARGYFGRPGLTAERWRPDPLSPQPGTRMYWTGDLACYTPDGDLEFLGRIDHQVKVRGFRIELGEIESAIYEQHAVRQCVVIAHQDGPVHLTAYVVPDRAQEVTSSDLRSALAARLPDYMVPGAFVVLEALPLTPNGKVDRRALPAPEGRPRRAGPVEGPRTPTEEVVAGLWAEVLGVEAVGREENFFALGGHSLLATQLISRVRAVFGVEVPVRTVFDTPTVAGLSACVEQGRGAAPGDLAPPLVPAARVGAVPLSFAQQRLWFLDQLEGGSAPYNMPMALRLTGRVEVGVLAGSMTAVVRRHEALRTTFVWGADGPVQVITPSQPVPLPVVDLQALSEGTRAAEVERLARAEAHGPFALERDVLLRVRLLRLGAEAHVLLVTLHHIVCDGWSLGVMVREMTQFYQAGVGGQPARVPALPLQYADYALWQRQWLHGAVLEAQVGYWREQLAGAPAVLEFPTDRPRPPVQTFRGGAEVVRLSAALTRQLQRVSRAAGVTLYMTVLGAFATLLGRYSGQEDLVIGTPIANRTRHEVEGLIGFFVNTLALRLDLRGNPTFEELWGRVREVTLGAYAHQEVPFEKLVEELQPVRSLSHSPLFQVMLVLQNAPQEALGWAGLRVEPMAVAATGAKFELTLALEEGAAGLVGVWEYNRDLFAAATIRRLATHFETLLHGVVAAPGQRLSALPLLSEAERAQLLWGWNATQAAYPQAQGVAQLFEAQVARTPEAVAVVYAEHQVSYQALNRRANQVAHSLRALGVGPDVLVGLCVERSLEMVLGLLGILKAGGAYVPLDPTYPAERLAFMLADAQVAVLLTQQHWVAGLPETPAPVLCLDTAWGSLATAATTNPPPTVHGDHLAYVMYTSGSTGTPKGVAIPQRAVTRLIWNTNYIRLTAADGVAQASNASFDAATFEIWGALCHGARLVHVPQEVSLAPPALATHLRAQHISVLFVTTALFNHIARVVPEAFQSVRHVLFGGETVTPPWVATVRQAGPPERLVHVYGPTESTTFASWYMVQDVPEAATTIPIGRPLANTQLYVLDRHREPVAIGVPGEVYIGGEGLAHGYLKRPGLTAATFIPHPWSAVPGARLYQTGDLARYLPEGNLEFLGRRDAQVKVRGFRIELGEIETVLSQHPAVREAVALVREDHPGERRLVAYLVAQPHHLVTPSDLRGFLQAKVPDYMVPGAFVGLEAMPLTPNGKVDRRALPAPEGRPRRAGQVGVPPRTPTEEVVAGLWAEVLGVEQVGREENFFALGGHSLLATQLISRVRAVFGVEVPVRTVFDTPTVAGLSACVEHGRGEEQGVMAPPLVPAARAGAVPLSFAQQRLWFLDQLEGGSAPYNMPMALRLTGGVEVGALAGSVTAVVRRHEALRTTFPTLNGSPVQVIVPSQPVPLPVVDLQALSEGTRAAEVERLARAEAHGPFALERDVLLRVRLLRLGAEAHVLLVTLHHIVCDGWSLGVMVREMTQLYQAGVAGQPAPLPALPLQYADYAIWQRQWLQGEVLEAQVRYWKKQLAGMPTLKLPTDRLRPAVQTFRGTRQSLQLPKKLSEALKALSRQEGVTLFMTLMAAFKIMLHYHTGQDDIVIGTDSANRSRFDIEGIIGFFVNQLVLRTNLSGNPTFRTLLGLVREVTLGAYAHQDLPFDKLVEVLNPERDLSRTPLFQVKLALENFPITTLELSGQVLSLLEVDSETVKFDLVLSMWETEHGLAGSLEYRTDLFNAITVASMMEDFKMILSTVITQPDVRLNTLVDILKESDRQRRIVKQQAFKETRRRMLENVKRRRFVEKKDSDKPSVLETRQ